jgi:hypothetical protein
MKNNLRNRPIDNESGNILKGLAWGLVFSGLLWFVAYLIVVDLERDSYQSPADAAQQSEGVNHG